MEKFIKIAVESDNIQEISYCIKCLTLIINVKVSELVSLVTPEEKTDKALEIADDIFLLKENEPLYTIINENGNDILREVRSILYNNI